MRQRALALLLAGLVMVGAAGCGEEEPAFELTTPPAQAGAFPLVGKDSGTLVDPEVTKRFTQRVRPAIQGWSDAIAAGDIESASRFFDLPAVVGQVGQPVIELRTPATVRSFNVSLACAPRLISLVPDGRYVVGSFVQDALDGRDCAEAGDVARIGFVFGDPDHPRRFTEWWETANRPDSRPRDALPVAPLQIVPRG